MALRRVALKPGVVRDVTNYAAEGGWWATEKARFVSGQPEKMGGWITVVNDMFVGTCTSMFNWAALSGDNYLSVGSNLKYQLEYGGAIYDITPIRRTATLGNNPFTTSITTTTVTVAHVAHGALLGDYVTFSGSSGAIGGVPAAEFNAEHTITRVVDADSYEITVTTTATSTASGGGAAVVAEYQIHVGLAIYVGGTGYGVGGYGVFPYGSATPFSIGTQLRMWTQANFGEDLVFCDRGGEIYYWDVTSGISSRAIRLVNITGNADVPTIASGVLVTEDRHVVAWGCNAQGEAAQDSMLIRWADTESLGVWTDLEENSAGYYRLSSGSTILAGRVTKQETLFWTDSGLYSMQYVGAPFIFGFNLLESNTSLIGPNTIALSGNTVYWMGHHKFYVYSGKVATLPCPMLNYIFDDFNFDQNWQATAGTNERYNEIFWFFCSAAATSPDRYVVYNYVDNIWYFGTLARTAWLDCPLRGYPIAANAVDSKIYLHDYGLDDGTTDPVQGITAYVESADTDIDDGEHFSFVRRVLPDVTFSGSTAANPSATLTVKVRDQSGETYGQDDSGSVTRTATSPVEQYTSVVYTRLRGRQMAFRLESTATGVKWHLGTPRIDIQADGKR